MILFVFLFSLSLVCLFSIVIVWTAGLEKASEFTCFGLSVFVISIGFLFDCYPQKGHIHPMAFVTTFFVIICFTIFSVILARLKRSGLALIISLIVGSVAFLILFQYKNEYNQSWFVIISSDFFKPKGDNMSLILALLKIFFAGILYSQFIIAFGIILWIILDYCKRDLNIGVRALIGTIIGLSSPLLIPLQKISANLNPALAFFCTFISAILFVAILVRYDSSVSGSAVAIFCFVFTAIFIISTVLISMNIHKFINILASKTIEIPLGFFLGASIYIIFDPKVNFGSLLSNQMNVFED